MLGPTAETSGLEGLMLRIVLMLVLGCVVLLLLLCMAVRAG